MPASRFETSLQEYTRHLIEINVNIHAAPGGTLLAISEPLHDLREAEEDSTVERDGRRSESKWSNPLGEAAAEQIVGAWSSMNQD